MHVMISYKSEDRMMVFMLVGALQGRGVKVWYDQGGIAPGDNWQQIIDQALNDSEIALICIGRLGVAGWQEDEMQIILSYRKKGKIKKVIPVILPGTPDDLQIPAFLEPLHQVNFREGLSNEYQFESLMWGITKEKSPKLIQLEDERKGIGPTPKKTTKPSRSKEQIQIDKAIEHLSEKLKNKNITFFIGNAAFEEATEPPETPVPSLTNGSQSPPGSFQLRCALLNELELIPNTCNEALMPSIDYTGTYYTIKASEERLQEHVSQLTATGAEGFPDSYLKLADLLHTQREQNTVGDDPQLIVTTTYEVLLEGALLQQGLPFTRLVYNASEGEVTASLFPRLSGETLKTIQNDKPDTWIATISKSPYCTRTMPFSLSQMSKDEEGIDPLRSIAEKVLKENSDALSKNEMDRVKHLNRELECQSIILYKLHGSVDVKNSRSISTRHYLNFIWNRSKYKFFSGSLSNLISNTPALFMGFGLLDPDLRVTYLMLRNLLESSYGGKRYILPVKPRGKEAELWAGLIAAPPDWLRLSILMLVKEDGKMLNSEGFLEALKDHFTNSLERDAAS